MVLRVIGRQWLRFAPGAGYADREHQERGG
jgi:hypothetical protein